MSRKLDRHHREDQITVCQEVDWMGEKGKKYTRVMKLTVKLNAKVVVEMTSDDQTANERWWMRDSLYNALLQIRDQVSR